MVTYCTECRKFPTLLSLVFGFSHNHACNCVRAKNLRSKHSTQSWSRFAELRRRRWRTAQCGTSKCSICPSNVQCAMRRSQDVHALLKSDVKIGRKHWSHSCNVDSHFLSSSLWMTEEESTLKGLMSGPWSLSLSDWRARPIMRAR